MSQAPSAQRAWAFAVPSLLPPAMLVAGMLALSLLRGTALDRQRAAFVDCAGCFVSMALHADLALVALALALCAASGWMMHPPAARTRAQRVIVFAALGALLVAIAVDIGLSATLGHRLLWADVRQYGRETGAIVDIALPYLQTPHGALAGAALLIAFAGLAATLFGRWRLRPSLAPAVVSLAAAAAAAGALRTPGFSYFDAAVVGNVVAIQRLDSGLRHHSDEMAGALRALPEPPRHCHPLVASAAPRTIIVVVLESWSLHHSRLFSGLGDRTPRLDRWAERGRWFPEFVANSYSTEAALIALLNGSVPIPSHRSWGALAFREVDGDFHRWLASRGWHTHFATSGALHFGDREAVLRQLGIASIEGAEHPAYAGRPRGAFDAASDRALVDRVLHWYDHERPDRPAMATVLTVGTHPPFIDAEPHDPHRPGEAAAVQRMDEAVGRLLSELEARGAMADGTVVVLGDHRAMTPITRDEVRRFGESSTSRVPAFALGVGADGGRTPGAFQQTDLIPSLRALLEGEDCRTDWQGRFLGPAPRPADVVVYAHPVLRNELRVQMAGNTYRLRLDGDDTGWVGDVPPGGEAVLREAMRQRLSRDQP